ncbi:hypothetical protein [Thomasclavelia cocleata]|uniref:hypothetical protein n=1 Tax=Thomasclavelia cocleata TaxID=69824 RepID=UPI003EBBF35F
MVETQKANNFITAVEKLAADNGLEIEINMDELEVFIGFASLLEAKMVDIEVPEVLQKSKPKQRGGRPKGGSKQNVISIQKFKNALHDLDKGTLAQNITAAIDITGLSKSFLTRLYYTSDETVKIDDRCHEMLKKLMKPEDNDPVVEKNMIMIRRVARAKKTDDPYMIADTIMNSFNMQKQTTFKDAAEVIDFIREHVDRNAKFGV